MTGHGRRPAAQSGERLARSPADAHRVTGLSVEETASALDMSVQTVMRDWKFAKAWLSKELRDQGAPNGAGDGKVAAS